MFCHQLVIVIVIILMVNKVIYNLVNQIIRIRKLINRCRFLYHHHRRRQQQHLYQRQPPRTVDEFRMGITFVVKLVGCGTVPRPNSRMEIVSAMRRIRSDCRLRKDKKRKTIMTVSDEGLKIALPNSGGGGGGGGKQSIFNTTTLSSTTTNSNNNNLIIN